MHEESKLFPIDCLHDGERRHLCTADGSIGDTLSTAGRQCLHHRAFANDSRQCVAPSLRNAAAACALPCFRAITSAVSPRASTWFGSAPSATNAGRISSRPNSAAKDRAVSPALFIWSIGQRVLRTRRPTLNPPSHRAPTTAHFLLLSPN